jgi:S1-C subfamily serine protease
VALAAALLLAGCDVGDGNGDGGEAATGGTVATVTVERPTAEPAPDSEDDDAFGRIPEIVQRVEPSVVAIALPQGGEGSGVVWDDEGAIVTNNHVVDGASAVEVVLATGETVRGQVEAADELSDLAVVRVDRDNLRPADFAETLPIVGELAVAMGNPLGFEQSVTAGIVSGLNRSIPSGGNTPALVELIQTDAAISPGNSGGALVNADGEVIGINVAYLPPSETGAVSLGFAIPSTVALEVVAQLLESGEVRRPYLGIDTAQVTPEFAEAFGLDVEEGVAVAGIRSDGPAGEAGLREGDVIVAVEGEETPTVESLFARLRDFEPGDTVTLDIVRGTERRSVDVTLGERPPQAE